MEAEQVVAKILADAKAEAEKIRQQADEKEAAERDKLAEQLDHYKKQTEVLAQKAGEDEESHILASARMEMARQFLAEKRKILDEVFERAHQQVQNMPAQEYRHLCKKLIFDAVETGDEEVVIDTKEIRIDQEFINQVNSELGSGDKGRLRLSDQRQDLGGGFILRRGKIKTNVSLDVLVDQARKELEIELAKQLFEG